MLRLPANCHYWYTHFTHLFSLTSWITSPGDTEVQLQLLRLRRTARGEKRGERERSWVSGSVMVCAQRSSFTEELSETLQGGRLWLKWLVQSKWCRKCEGWKKKTHLGQRVCRDAHSRASGAAQTLFLQRFISLVDLSAMLTLKETYYSHFHLSLCQSGTPEEKLCMMCS